MKKLFKILLKTALVLAVLGVAGLITLRLMFPPEKVKTLALDYAKNNLHREMSFDKLSFNLIGVTLENFALSESSTFQEGTFVKADKLVVKVALLPLLKKRVEISTIEIDGLDVNIVKQKDGAFNFDSLLSSSSTPAEAATAAPVEKTAETDTSSSLVLLAETIEVKDCNFYYKDLQTGTSTEVEKLNIEISDFDLASPFNTVISFTTAFEQDGGISVSVPVTLDFTAFLANLEMAKAYVKVNKISADYKTVKFLLKGEVNNFESPKADLTGSLSGINNLVLADLLPDLPNFTLPVINLTLKADADLNNSSAVINQVALSVRDSSFSSSGKVNWGGAAPAYNLSGNLKIDLAQLVQMTDTISGFNAAGQISGSFKATEKKENKDISGTITLKDVSLFYAPFTAESLNGTIKLASLDDISCDSFTGLLNNEKFTSSFSYKNVKEVMNLALNLDLASLKLNAFPGQDNPEEKRASSESPSPETPEQNMGKTGQTPETFMNIKADVKVGAVQVPYFRTDGFSIKADLTQISSSMAKSNGQVSFNLQPGAITNLDSFVKENKIVKILLLPITVVRKVANMLHIDLFPAENESKKGEITFTSGEGVYTFTNGLMTLDKTSFLSKVTNLNGTGKINFATQALDMKVSATVLTSQTPIVIKIGGTMDNPSGKLDVVNTVTSVVGGILNYKTPGKVVTGTADAAAAVTKGVATTATDTVKGTVDAAKNTLKSIGSLFKKKTDTQEENQ